MQLFVSSVGWVLGLAPVPPFAWRTCPYLQRSSPKLWIPSAPLQWFRNRDKKPCSILSSKLALACLTCLFIRKWLDESCVPLFIVDLIKMFLVLFSSRKVGIFIWLRNVCKHPKVWYINGIVDKLVKFILKIVKGNLLSQCFRMPLIEIVPLPILLGKI